MESDIERDITLRADFLKYQIDEADKRLEKDRLKLRSSFKHKQKLIDMLKKSELKQAIEKC